MRLDRASDKAGAGWDNHPILVLYGAQTTSRGATVAPGEICDRGGFGVQSVI